MRHRILCDMDSIVVDLMEKWLEENNRRHDDDLTIDKILTWDTHLYSKGGEDVYRILEQPGFFRDLNPLPGAIEGVKELVDSGHEVFMVTAATYPHNMPDKALWCRQHLPFIDKRHIVFAYEKHIIPADVIIDDGPHNAEAYAKAHPHAQVIGIEYPYNRDCPHYTLLASDWRDTAAAWKRIVEALKR